MSSPSAQSSATSAHMNTESQSRRDVNSGLPSHVDDVNNTYQIHDFGPWNHPGQGSFPSPTLQGPGQAGPSSPSFPDLPPLPKSGKGKRAASPDPAEVDPPSAIGYVGRKNTAYEIWIFTRAIETDENVPAERWPDDYNQYLTKRPDTMFVGCKFCTQNANGTKMWKVFYNRRETSPTSTLRYHFKHEHLEIWKSECNRLRVPQKSPSAQVLVRIGEPFSQEGFEARLLKFIISSNQSIDIIESPRFRELLLYFAQGNLTDDDIPHREYLEKMVKRE